MIPLFIFLLVLTILLNEVLFHYSTEKLAYHMDIDGKLFEIGDEMVLTSTVENRKVLSVPFLRVDEYFPSGFSVSQNTYSLFLLPHQRVKRTYPVKAVARGLYKVEEASLKTGDLFGFHHRYLEFPLKKEVIILPEKRELKDAIIPYGGLYGAFSVKRWIIDDPLMIRGIREHTGNDGMRHIHWGSSLRHNRLMVKEFDFTEEKSVLVYLNMESVKPFWNNPDSDALEETIIIARAVMEALYREKIPFGFASNAYSASGKRRGYFYPPGRSEKSLEKYREILGGLGGVIAMPFEESLKDISRNRKMFQTIVIVTPKVLREYVEPLKMFARHGGKTVLISAQGENLELMKGRMEIYKGVDIIDHAAT